MAIDKDAFLSWQKLWRRYLTESDLFGPASSVDGIEKKLQQLSYMENWLQLQVQAVRWQQFLLEQQRVFISALPKKDNKSSSEENEKDSPG